MSVFSPSPHLKDEEAAFAASRASMIPRPRSSWVSWMGVMLMIALAGAGMIFLNMGLIHVDPPALAAPQTDFPETNRQ